MSHHHHTDEPGPTMEAFLAPLIGSRVALHRHTAGPVVGDLEAVTDPVGVDHDVTLIVAGVPVPLSAVARIKLHFAPDGRKRR